MKFLTPLFLCLIPKLCESVLYKSNTTDLTKCTVSYCRSGSTYKDFFPIHINENTFENGSLILDFHFAVLASSDAHILLSPTENVDKVPVYEIVIGAGGNTFADIRRMQKSDVKASVRIKGMLSALDPHFFWLHITRVGAGGLIEVGKEGVNSSFISWLDPDPLYPKLISFSTWSGIEAKWYFNCDRSGNEEEIEKKLTTLERLRRDLLNYYDPVVRPVTDESHITTVFMSLMLGYLELDEHRSTMDLIGSTRMIWHDEKLQWDPEEYSGIKTINVLRKEIWQPDLICSNAVTMAGINNKHILEDSMMVVSHLGDVEWNPVLRLTAWCDAGSLGEWPRDTHTCQLMFAFIRDAGQVRLEFNKKNTTMLQHGASQWLVLEVSVYATEENPNDTAFPVFSIKFTIKRSSNIYNIIFFTPFLVIAVTLLLSFWVSPFGHIKISMGCAQLIIETIMLLALATFVPNSSKYVPFLVSLYSYSLVASLLSLIISIIVINFSRNKRRGQISHITSNIITSKFVRSALYLPNVVKADKYGDLNAESLKSEDKDQSLWILLGVTIDRISFLVYTPLVAYVIGKHIASNF